jgi:hypothetical protein
LKSFKPITDWDSVPLIFDLPLASRIVGFTPEYLKKMAQRGDFPAFKVGCQWRVGKNALINYVDGPSYGRK